METKIKELYTALLNTCGISNEASEYLLSLLSGISPYNDNNNEKYDLIIAYSGETEELFLIKTCSYQKLYNAITNPAHNFLEFETIYDTNNEGAPVCYNNSNYTISMTENQIITIDMGVFTITIDQNNNYNIENV